MIEQMFCMCQCRGPAADPQLAEIRRNKSRGAGVFDAGQIDCVPGGSRPLLAATDSTAGPPTRPRARTRAWDPTRPRRLRAAGPCTLPAATRAPVRATGPCPVPFAVCRRRVPPQFFSNIRGCSDVEEPPPRFWRFAGPTREFVRGPACQVPDSTPADTPFFFGTTPHECSRRISPPLPASSPSAGRPGCSCPRDRSPLGLCTNPPSIGQFSGRRPYFPAE